MLKVVFYSRVSTDEEKQLNALDKQIQELTDYIHSQKDWVLVDKYIDEGISGTTSKGRYEYNRLYNDLLTDKFDIVVIKDQSRLMHNVLDWYLFLDRVLKNGKQIFMYLDNSFYTPDNAFISGIKAMMAEEYSRDLSRKNMNMSDQNNLCVTESRQKRSHTEKIYSQKVRRIIKRSAKSWLYFNVYI